MITLNQSIEGVFLPSNIDQDCDRIAALLEPFRLQIYSDLDTGNSLAAVNLFLELLTSTAHHFIADEHWCYFDDYYSPDYLCMNAFEQFRLAHENQMLATEHAAILFKGLQEVGEMEAVRNYGYPSVDRWLGEMKSWE